MKTDDIFIYIHKQNKLGLIFRNKDVDILEKNNIDRGRWVIRIVKDLGDIKE